ncbi:MAG TPA: kelch repeat-containing protein, partial [Acidimicrobiales bacterium]
MGSWRQIAPLPGPREAAAAVFHGGKAYLFGGDATSDGIEAYQNNTWIYDPAGNTWTTGAVLPTNGLCYAFSTADDGIHVVFIRSGNHYAYDPTTNTWATRTAAPGPGRLQAFHFVDSSGRFYLAGGSQLGGQTSTEVYRYDPVTDGWATRAAMPSALADFPTTAPGVLGTDNKVYLGRGSLVSTLLVYDPATDTWTTSPVMPDNRAFYPTVSRLPAGTIITLPHRTLPTSGGNTLTRRIDGYTPGVGWAMGVTPDYPGVVHAAAVATEPGGVIYLLGGTYQNADGYAFAVTDCWAYKQNDPPLV